MVSPPLQDPSPLGVWRAICEACLTARGQRKTGARGVGRVGADFWPVLSAGRRKRSLVNRYPISDRAQLTMTNGTAQMLAPGPDGAVSTTRFEMLLEGAQECEARVFIEKTLLDKVSRANLGDGLAKKVQSLLDERVRRKRTAHCLGKESKGWDWFAEEAASPACAAELFSAAAAVAQALGAAPKE